MRKIKIGLVNKVYDVALAFTFNAFLGAMENSIN